MKTKKTKLTDGVETTVWETAPTPTPPPKGEGEDSPSTIPTTPTTLVVAGKAGSRSRGYFPRVKEAREALAARAIEVLETYLAVVGEARADHEHAVALSGIQWLMEHMPRGEGETIVDISIDKSPTVKVATPAQLPSGPTLNIGLTLGGITTKQPTTNYNLASGEVIDAVHEDVDE